MIDMKNSYVATDLRTCDECMIPSHPGKLLVLTELNPNTQLSACHAGQHEVGTNGGAAAQVCHQFRAAASGQVNTGLQEPDDIYLSPLAECQHTNSLY